MQMNEMNKKPRIAEILGVLVDETFEIHADTTKTKAKISKDGFVESVGVGWQFDAFSVCNLINGRYKIIRKPQFSTDELAMLRLLYDNNVHYIARDNNGEIFTYQELPIELFQTWDAHDYCELPQFLFPQVQWSDVEPLNIENILRDAGMING